LARGSSDRILRTLLRSEQGFETLPFCYCDKVAVSIRDASKPYQGVKGNYLITEFLKEWLHLVYLY
jgi:hypothetical protein